MCWFAREKRRVMVQSGSVTVTAKIAAPRRSLGPRGAASAGRVHARPAGLLTPWPSGGQPGKPSAWIFAQVIGPEAASA
jgi:hypothetical protein